CPWSFVPIDAELIQSLVTLRQDRFDRMAAGIISKSECFRQKRPELVGHVLLRHHRGELAYFALRRSRERVEPGRLRAVLLAVLVERSRPREALEIQAKASDAHLDAAPSLLVAK